MSNRKKQKQSTDSNSMNSTINKTQTSGMNQMTPDYMSSSTTTKKSSSKTSSSKATDCGDGNCK